jgi:hypothetical protein
MIIDSHDPNRTVRGHDLLQLRSHSQPSRRIGAVERARPPVGIRYGDHDFHLDRTALRPIALLRIGGKRTQP